MVVLNLVKGRSTIGELETISNRIFHTLYYQNYLAEEAKRKQEEEKNKNKHQSSKPRNPMDDMRASVYQADSIEDELEELVEEGMI